MSETESTLEDPPAASAEEEASPPAIAEVTTRGFIGRPLFAIFRITSFGFAAVLLSLAIGLPIFVAGLVMLAAITFAVMRYGGDLTVRLTEDGVERTIVPLLADALPFRTRHQRFAFDEIRSYRRDHDKGYFGREISFLNLKLKRWPYSLKIQNQGGRVDIEPFADAFEEMAARHDVRRLPLFYATMAARLLTAFFMVLIAGLGYLALEGFLSANNVLALQAVLVPGTVYMLNRTISAAQREKARRAGD